MDVSNAGRCNITLPNKCPLCGSAITPKVLVVSRSKDLFQDESIGLSAAMACPWCHKLFVVLYGNGAITPSQNITIYNNIIQIGPTNPETKQFEKNISDLSPLFVEIYNQALAAEAYNLTHIAGMGYRKALEFLIKDYAKKVEPGETETIETMQLSPCIQKYIEQPKIKALATASTWLGNDEAHYVRKHADKDVEDLKRLINSCVSWIQADIDADEASAMIAK